MSAPYRNNVVVAAGYDGTFSPPLDAIWITANASIGETDSVTFTVGSTTVPMPKAEFTAGQVIRVGDVSQITVTPDNTFAYIGLRVRNKSGSANVTNDSLSVVESGGGGEGGEGGEGGGR